MLVVFFDVTWIIATDINFINLLMPGVHKMVKQTSKILDFQRVFLTIYWTLGNIGLTSEATTKGILWKKLFLKIPKYSQKNACVGVSL